MLIRVRPAINDEHARERLVELAAAKDEKLAELSRFIGRPDGYLGRYVRQGTPKRLPVDARQRLAGYFGVEECELAAMPR